jgi:flagellar M-ring protein FliF
VQQVVNIWSALNPRKRLMVAFASLVVFASVLAIGRMAGSPNMTLLYAGLEANAAGDVIRALEQQGVFHEVRGGAIYVDRAARDTLRMTLASEGLPANNAQGYELLESLTGFGTTSQMFDAAYWRAKEGELARTIVSIPSISAARVHIANTTGNPFQREARPSASVTLTMSSGSLSVAQARAIRSLVSSAIASLKPEDVAIIDSVAGLVGGADGEQSATTGDDRSEAMRERALRLLEARVGTGNAMVEVNITTNLESETIRERLVDPESRVAISVDSEEMSTESTNAEAGTVTVASNLPDGDARDDNGSRNNNNQTRERVNYEVSETSRELMRAAGMVKRITVAVLVNAVQQTGPDGQITFQQRSDAELQDLRDLVSSAVGLDESRGDVVTLKSMEFLQPAQMGTEVVSTAFQGLALDAMTLIQLAVLAIVALVLGLFVLRPILTGAHPTRAIQQGSGGNALALTSPSSSTEAMIPLTGEIADDTFSFPSKPGIRMQRDDPSSDIPLGTGDPLHRLRNLIAERQDETVEILRGWLENKGEKA